MKLALYYDKWFVGSFACDDDATLYILTHGGTWGRWFYQLGGLLLYSNDSQWKLRY